VIATATLLIIARGALSAAIPPSAAIPLSAATPSSAASTACAQDTANSPSAAIDPSKSSAKSSATRLTPSSENSLREAKEVRAAIDSGLAFLLASQEHDGTWGSARNGTYTDLWSNPETHRSWAIGTTGLACMALLEQGSGADAQRALKRGIDALIAGASLKRPNEWDLDNVWGYLYALQALSHCLADARFAADPGRDAMRAAAEKHMTELLKLQSPNGGWGYYAMPGAAWNPEWSTSFTTAAIVIALVDARAAGLAVEPRVIERAVRAIERCRLPTGSYTYSVEVIPSPGRMEGIDQVKSAIGRIQVCNLALVRARKALEQDSSSTLGRATSAAPSDSDHAMLGRVAPTIDAAELKRGLDQFFEHHRFFDIGRRRPIPHEAYYAVAGYFYFFGHWYAAGVIDELPSPERAAYAAKLAQEIVKTQEQDGSMRDYLMHDYVRQYSTAYGVMALGRCLATMNSP
jgi:hypothetical protein